ncbi:Cuticle Protein CPAP1 [Hyalella azteca]|uniref:Cuticle Protein CPAP1 n=1 Tax=Hyalella azteca TaxID=294128 RepID=A0A6A0GZP7_HYAAZ|nr:uncharacterized protein LOC108679644 [Hyalella azteca]KAA0194022.1 Cuticle Protein CPAP1 [Hyalella azteca]
MRSWRLTVTLLLVAAVAADPASKKKSRTRTIPFRYVDPSELGVAAPKSFSFQGGGQRTNLHGNIRRSSSAALADLPRQLKAGGLPLEQHYPHAPLGFSHPQPTFALAPLGPEIPTTKPQKIANRIRERQAIPSFDGQFQKSPHITYLPETSLTYKPRIHQDFSFMKSDLGIHQQITPLSKSHLRSSALPITTSHKILEGPYLIDGEENISVLPLTSSITLLKDKQKLHPSLESSVRPIQTSHHLLTGTTTYTPPVYSPSAVKAGDPYKTSEQFSNELDPLYSLFLNDGDAHFKSVPNRESISPQLFESAKLKNDKKIAAHLNFARTKAGIDNHGGIFGSNLPIGSAIKRHKPRSSTLSSAPLNEPSLTFLEPFDQSYVFNNKPDVTESLKSLDSRLSSRPRFSSPMPPMPTNFPLVSLRPAQNGILAHHKTNGQSASSRPYDSFSFTTPYPRGEAVTTEQFYNSLLTAQKQINSLLDKYTSHGTFQPSYKPKFYHSKEKLLSLKPHIKETQSKLLLKTDVSTELYGKHTSIHHDTSDFKSQDSTKSLLKDDQIKSSEINFMGTHKNDEHTNDNFVQDLHKVQIKHVIPSDQKHVSQQKSRVTSDDHYIHKEPHGSQYSDEYDSKIKSYSYELYDDYSKKHRLPTHHPHRKQYDSPKEIKLLKPVYSDANKREAQRGDYEAPIKNPSVGRHYKNSNRIPGVAGKDYPLYNEIPHTSFSCSKVPHRPGMYANIEAQCQVYHVCYDDRYGDQGAAFLCTNGTLFNQVTFSCDWWYNVDCQDSIAFYDLNLNPEVNPYYRKEHYYVKEPTVYGRSEPQADHTIAPLTGHKLDKISEEHKSSRPRSDGNVHQSHFRTHSSPSLETALSPSSEISSPSRFFRRNAKNRNFSNDHSQNNQRSLDTNAKIDETSPQLPGEASKKSFATSYASFKSRF